MKRNNDIASSFQSFNRASKLRKLLQAKKIVRILEAHNGLTGIIVEKTKIQRGKNILEFDGIWESSLTDSVSRGKPDIAVVDMTSRIYTLHEILDVTTKPIIVDANNGGFSEHFDFLVRTLERIGISAVVIEDKIGIKRNSLTENHKHKQDTIENFCKKIKLGKSRQVTKDFMIIARVESLILKKGIADALKRAQAYIKAGADGIIIHSKEKTPDEILVFSKQYQRITKKTPLIVIPTTYHRVSETELIKAKIKMVIYANQLLRSAYPSMLQTAKSILQNGRSIESDKFCIPVSDILRVVPFSGINC